MSFRIPLAIALLCITSLTGVAADLIWTGATDSDFLTPGNWDGGAPSSDEDVVIIEGGANLPVIIPLTAETITIGAFQLGSDGDAGGHVVQNGGTLIVYRSTRTACSQILNSKAILATKQQPIQVGP